MQSSAGIDYFIGDPNLVRRGVGTMAIAAFTTKLFADYEEVNAIVVTPQAANVGSCRVLEKTGYERVWVGTLDSDDPSDAGTSALYLKQRH